MYFLGVRLDYWSRSANVVGLEGVKNYSGVHRYAHTVVQNADLQSYRSTMCDDSSWSDDIEYRNV